MSERRSHKEMAFELGKMVWSKDVWLEGVGAKRPQHEIQVKIMERAVLEQARQDYETAAKRPGVKDASKSEADNQGR